MTDAEYDFCLFWKEILQEERQKGNSKRVKEIENMLKHEGFQLNNGR